MADPIHIKKSETMASLSELLDSPETSENSEDAQVDLIKEEAMNYCGNCDQRIPQLNKWYSMEVELPVKSRAVVVLYFCDMNCMWKFIKPTSPRKFVSPREQLRLIQLASKRTSGELKTFDHESNQE